MSLLKELRFGAVETLHTGIVVDKYKWNVFCTMLKTFPCTDAFSTDDLFKIMTQCCNACQKDIYHHEEEHGSCCGECAKEKETSEDIMPFIMKEYYHAHKRQYDDETDIWFAQGDTPVVYRYEVIKDCLPRKIDFSELCRDTCAICSRLIPPGEVENNLSYIV